MLTKFFLLIPIWMDGLDVMRTLTKHLWGSIYENGNGFQLQWYAPEPHRSLTLCAACRSQTSMCWCAFHQPLHGQGSPKSNLKPFTASSSPSTIDGGFFFRSLQTVVVPVSGSLPVPLPDLPSHLSILGVHAGTVSFTQCFVSGSYANREIVGTCGVWEELPMK